MSSGSPRPAARVGSCRPTAITASRCSFHGGIDCPHGVAPGRMPRADATELAPKKSAATTLPCSHRAREGGWFSMAVCSGTMRHPHRVAKESAHFFGKFRAEALGYPTRRSPGGFCRALPRIALHTLGYRSCLRRRVSYPAPFMLPSQQQSCNLRNQPANCVARSRGKRRVRYSPSTPAAFPLDLIAL